MTTRNQERERRGHGRLEPQRRGVPSGQRRDGDVDLPLRDQVDQIASAVVDELDDDAPVVLTELADR